MELIRLGAKSVNYWVLSLLILILCLSLRLDKDEPVNLEPLNLNSLIKVEPNFLYRSDNKFNAMVVGELKLDINLENVKSNFTQYNLIIFSNLDYQTNTNITLNWIVNEIKHQTPINLSKHSKTFIDFKTEDSNQINELYLLISQETTLGTEHSFQDEVSFQAIYLDNQNNHSTFLSNWNQWTGFNPIRFSSINSNTENTKLIYKSLILRLSFWLIGTVTLFFIFKVHTKHLISSFFIAWIMTTTIHINNRFHQNQQIKSSFKSPDSNLNLIDTSSEQLAIKIKTSLNSLAIKPNIKNKIILIGGDEFFNQRLMHHLKEYNVSLNLFTSDLFETNDYKNKTYIFSRDSKIYCSELALITQLGKPFKITHTDQEYCIAREK